VHNGSELVPEDKPHLPV